MHIQPRHNNYKHVREHAHLIHVHVHQLCTYIIIIYTHIYIADMRTKKVSKCVVTSKEAFLVKIANGNVMPTLRGFRWYPYFGAQE